MKTMSKVLLLLLLFFSSHTVYALDISIVPLPVFEVFRQPSFQTDIFTSARQIEESVLLQEFGNVDEVRTFLFSNLPEDLSIDDIEFAQSSSDENVFSISGRDNILASSSFPGTFNVSCTFSFDEMVGTTEYVLTLINKTTGEIIDSKTVLFTIAGVTFYQELTPGNFTVVSGEGRSYSIPYEMAMQKHIDEEYKIRCLIQFPDGTSTSGSLGGPLPRSDSLQFSVSDATAEFTHNKTECDSKTLGTYSDSNGVQFPSGCGFGLYSDLDGSLRFGVLYNPYRIGNFTVHSSWSGLTSDTPHMSSEIFEGLLNVFITGTPPVVILDVHPNDPLLRPEGGEYINLDVINTDWRDISSFRLQIPSTSETFKELPGSYKIHNSTEEVSFLTQPGNGANLTWEMEYTEHLKNSSSPDSHGKAIMIHNSDTTFSYDDQSLKIENLTPNNSPGSGGTKVTVQGYFPNFDADAHGVYFSGMKLDREYISSVQNDKIVISVPPRSDLGSSFEFLVTVRIGNGVSNSELFFFNLENATIRISQSGTSRVDDEIYKVGDCTPARFTAIVQPLTSQIQSYHWSLFLAGNSAEELFISPNFTYVNASAQTIELQPDSFNATLYILRVEVTLLHTTIWEEISLLRDHVVSVGAYILEVPRRTISSPDVPLRLSAVVEPPGSCYNGNWTMMYEWEAFGTKHQFSSSNATGLPIDSSLTVTPDRLGRELIVQREHLTHGHHNVSFKVWMADQEHVFGFAKKVVKIEKSSLVAVIRHGENQITLNRQTSITIFGTASYDPDVLAGSRSLGISHEWSCRHSLAALFQTADSVPCAPTLLPDSTSAEFVITSAVLEALQEIKSFQYNLTVRKNEDRVSSTSSMVINLQDGGVLPFLTDFSFNVTNGDGIVQDFEKVSYYEPLIISVEAPAQVTWTYELSEPKEKDFFLADNLIQNPDFFSVEDSLSKNLGSRKPLGIESRVLRPYTTYTFTVKFGGSAEYKATSAEIVIRTIESPTVSIPKLPISEGTTDTQFTATAGIPSTSATFSFYFMLSDSSGSSFCLGGCTGYDIVHFQVGRPGKYSLSVYVFDMQGKALLASPAIPQNITVTAAENQSTTTEEFTVLFEQGDDNSWTQLAHDTALTLLQSQASGTAERNAKEFSSRAKLSPEDVLAHRMQTASELAIGARRIFCSSIPNTYHGINGMLLTMELMKQTILDEETIYNTMFIVDCCVRNTPARTMKSMGPLFPSFLENLNRLAKNIGQGGISRRRLRQVDVAPANVYADTQAWTAKPFTASVVSGKLGGFHTQLPIGTNGEYGEYSVVIASNDGHLPTRLVNGLSRKVIMGPSDNELFYARDKCLSNMFSLSGEEKRFLVLHSMENFLLYGFQDPPTGSNLADRLYWAKVFKEESNGGLVPVEMPKADPCFCWRLPVVRRRQFLEESLDFMPGMFTVSNLKKFGVHVSGKGEAYSYVYDGMKTSEYNATEGWVEACQDQSGLVSSTLVSKQASNAIAESDVTILGFNGTALAGMIIGGLLLIVAAVITSWLYASGTMNGTAPIEATHRNELYVERDVYGRGSTVEVNIDPEQ